MYVGLHMTQNKTIFIKNFFNIIDIENFPKLLVLVLSFEFL